MTVSQRCAIDQAMGVIMAEQRCSTDAAFGLLCPHSQNTNARLRDVAAGIIVRTEDGDA